MKSIKTREFRLKVIEGVLVIVVIVVLNFHFLKITRGSIEESSRYMLAAFYISFPCLLADITWKIVSKKTKICEMGRTIIFLVTLVCYATIQTIAWSSLSGEREMKCALVIMFAISIVIIIIHKFIKYYHKWFEQKSKLQNRKKS